MTSTEPVRTYLYGLLAPIVAVLVAYGVVDESTAALWIALATAVLGIPAVEAARAHVTPVGGKRAAMVASGKDTWITEATYPADAAGAPVALRDGYILASGRQPTASDAVGKPEGATCLQYDGEQLVATWDLVNGHWVKRAEG